MSGYRKPPTQRGAILSNSLTNVSHKQPQNWGYVLNVENICFTMVLYSLVEESALIQLSFTEENAQEGLRQAGMTALY